jgi:type IV pilus assembly protein PilM
MANLPQLGIDIGSSSIKVIELIPSGKKGWRLAAAASMPSPAGAIQPNATNGPQYSAAIARLVKESGARSRRVVVSIPEEQVSSHVVEMPAMKESEIDEALQWQVEQYIPIQQDQATWSYKILRQDANGMEILLVAASKELIKAYKTILEQAGLEVAALETELMATARAELTADSPLSVVVDIGSKTTDLGIVRGNELLFARTIPTAGEALSRALQTGMGLDSVQAEQFKNTYGFSKAQMDGKVMDAMKPVLTLIATEIKKTIDFYISKHQQESVRIVVLSGGVAAMPDIVNTMSGLLGMETVVGNPFNQVSMDKGQATSLAGSESFYAVAVGLAKREDI